MKCKCCYNEVDSKNTICHVCGFPLVIGQGVSEDIVRSLVNETRNKYLGGVSVNVRLYCYEVKDHSVVEAGSPVSHFFDALELKLDQDLFFTDQFEAVPSSREFNLDLEINRNGTVTSLSVPFKPSKTISHERLGARLMPGFRFRLIVGSEDNYVASKEYPLI